ncbi:MAG: universal stress protein [Oscillochloris sp.]|nr:universal stress protein [Oscillochloris sp.]
MTQMSQLAAAVADFRRLRRQADIERLLARIRGHSADLLPFEEIRRRLRATASSDHQLREIPLDAIVGSVGRYHDFTRGFLPRQDSDEGRWARVMLASNDFSGLPPIEVYQIGDAYFVADGNHRVSVARQNGATMIQAYVLPFRTRVSLTPADNADDLILRGEQAAFLEWAKLDESRPTSDMALTAPGQYANLREHIEVHGYYRGLELQQPVPPEEAAVSWYDTVYLPIAQLIRERGLLREFPGRTEADLYLWLAEHRAELQEHLGWDVTTDRAADDLAERKGCDSLDQVRRTGEHMLEMVIPDNLDSGPPTGNWRQAQPLRSDTWLFRDILVPVNGQPDGWAALEQSLAVAQREGAKLLGLHVVPTATQRNAPQALAVQEEFARRCAEAGVAGQMAIDDGPVARCIRDRSRWADLVAIQIRHPPGPNPLARLTSSLTGLIRSSIRPVLTVPQPINQLTRLLLAYDGSAKSNEALYLATYLAARWHYPVTVLTVSEDGRGIEGPRLQARAYLQEHGVTDIAFVRGDGSAGPAILAAAEEACAELIVMGGYGKNQLSGLMIGSAVEDVLRLGRIPALICQ